METKLLLEVEDDVEDSRWLIDIVVLDKSFKREDLEHALEQKVFECLSAHSWELVDDLILLGFKVIAAQKDTLLMSWH